MYNYQPRWAITWKSDWDYFGGGPKSVQAETWKEATRQWLWGTGFIERSEHSNIIEDTETGDGGTTEVVCYGRFVGDQSKTVESVTLWITAKAEH